MSTSTTAPRPLRRDAQRNRERIVAAARTAIAEHGCDVPVEEIARRAGVGIGTLYRRFPVKEELIDAVLEDAFEEFVRAAEEALADRDAWRGFCSFLERSSALHVENRGLKDLVLAQADGRTRLEAVRRRMRPLLERLIERAQAEGSLRPDLVAEDIPLLFWSTGRVVEATYRVAPGIWQRHLRLLLDGLRAEAATPLPHPPLTRDQLQSIGRTAS